MSWHINIFNPDGSKHAFAHKTVVAPGAGKNVTIPSHKYSCGYHHTLTGNQQTATSMNGNEVTPFPDPGAEQKSDDFVDPPSWDATSLNP